MTLHTVQRGDVTTRSNFTSCVQTGSCGSAPKSTATRKIVNPIRNVFLVLKTIFFNVQWPQSECLTSTWHFKAGWLYSYQYARQNEILYVYMMCLLILDFRHMTFFWLDAGSRQLPVAWETGFCQDKQSNALIPKETNSLCQGTSVCQQNEVMLLIYAQFFEQECILCCREGGRSNFVHFGCAM